jgi:hypothetical protein
MITLNLYRRMIILCTAVVLLLLGSTPSFAVTPAVASVAATGGRIAVDTPVAEPGTMLLLGAGLIGLGMIRRRHSR